MAPFDGIVSAPWLPVGRRGEMAGALERGAEVVLRLGHPLIGGELVEAHSLTVVFGKVTEAFLVEVTKTNSGASVAVVGGQLE